ncbi:hypothetical protein CG479_016570 [Bacillus cytotoxicus]|nr:hypothetical protein CG481_017175 [Bacillus cytotoxicus]AWC45969.1 hypothetical protein CG479_016570 [Bacillus cytotoxicus]
MKYSSVFPTICIEKVTQSLKIHIEIDWPSNKHANAIKILFTLKKLDGVSIPHLASFLFLFFYIQFQM